MNTAARLQRLEDIEAIRALKSRYCDICDAGHDPERIIDLFTADGIWETPEHGRLHGHDAIRQGFRSFGTSITFSQHNTTNLDLCVDGDTASGTWHFIGVVDLRDAPARMTLARYEERYVREAGTWKIQHLRAVVLARTELAALAR